MLISTADVANIKESLFRESAISSTRNVGLHLEYVIPILYDWTIQEDQESVFIAGTVRRHEHYPSGSRIKTSRIVSFQKINGRNIVATRNSMYELGNPIIQLHGDSKKFYQDIQHVVRSKTPDASMLSPDLEDITKLM